VKLRPTIFPLVMLAVLALALIYVRFRTEPSQTPTSPSGLPVYTYKIVNAYPHDPRAFTQGLAFENGFLYEGTGIEGESTLRMVELETGNVLKIHRLPDHIFGEGITILGDRIIQLTYTSRTGFVYDKTTFELLREFAYPDQGWGLTHDGTHLIMSDGTSRLHFLDPESFEEVSAVHVHADGIPVEGLNELEYVQGEVFANVRPMPRIARISPSTGEVTGWIDLKWLAASQDPGGKWGVLNGIAYDSENDRLFVTGKLWPKIFEIDLMPLRRD
jgi:glutamine cyclotransferase